jgi:hypothetical protein
MLIVYCTRPYMFPPQLSHNQKWFRCTLFRAACIMATKICETAPLIPVIHIFRCSMNVQIGYQYVPFWSRIHERTISLRFLGIILRNLRHEVSIYFTMFTLQTSFKSLLLEGRGGWGAVTVSRGLTVNSKEENSSDFCPNYVQEFGLCMVHSLPLFSDQQTVLNLDKLICPSHWRPPSSLPTSLNIIKNQHPIYN